MYDLTKAINHELDKIVEKLMVLGLDRDEARKLVAEVCQQPK